MEKIKRKKCERDIDRGRYREKRREMKMLSASVCLCVTGIQRERGINEYMNRHLYK